MAVGAASTFGGPRRSAGMKRRKNASTASRPSLVARSPRAALAAVLLDRQRVGRVVVAGAQRRQPLVPHQHQELGLGQMLRGGRVEAGRPVLDRDTSGRRAASAPASSAARGERLGAQALHRIAVDRLDFRAVMAPCRLTAASAQARGNAEFLHAGAPFGRRRRRCFLQSWRGKPNDDVRAEPSGRSGQAEGARDEYREIHGPRPRFRPVRPVAGPARGPPAIRPRTSAESPARRPGRAGGGPDRPLRRALARGAERGRGGARQAPQGRGRRGRAALSRAGAGARVRYRRKGRREGGRQVRHRRAAAARRWRWRRTTRPARS